ncbi:hypothetical protein Hte_001475 [Hypoxylon texense]
MVDGFHRRHVSVYNHHASGYEKDAPHPSYAMSSTGSFMLKGPGKGKSRSTSSNKAKAIATKPAEALFGPPGMIGSSADPMRLIDAFRETQVGGDDGDTMRRTLAGGAAGEQHGDSMREEDNSCTTTDNDQGPMKVSQLLDPIGMSNPAFYPVHMTGIEHTPSVATQTESRYEKSTALNDGKGVADAGALYTIDSSVEPKTLDEGAETKPDGSGVNAKLVSRRLETLLEDMVVQTVEEDNVPEHTSKETPSNDNHPLKSGDDKISTEPMELQERSISPKYSRKAESQSTESRDSSIDSDLLSISDDSDGPELLSVEDRIYLELMTLVISIIAGNTSEATGGQSSTQAGAGPAANNREYTSANSGASGPSKKRRRTRKSTEDSDDEDPTQPPSDRAARSDRGGRRKHLACPFAKMHPEKHVRCFSLKLSRIRDVKQHLHRKHTPEFYCQRCKVIFPDDPSLQEHIRNDAGFACDFSESLEGISLAQRQRLTRKSDSKLSLEEQWYSIWDILFPGRPRPDTVYVIFGFLADPCLVRGYFTSSYVADSLLEEMRDNGFNVPDGRLDDIRRNVIDRLHSIVEQGLSNQFANSMTLSETSPSIFHGTSTQPTRQDTPASSESSRVGLRYRSSAGVSRNRPRPNAEVVLHQRGVVQHDQQADQGAGGSPLVPLLNIDPALISLQNTHPTSLDLDNINWGESTIENNDIRAFDFNISHVDTSMDFLFSGAGHQPTQPDPR